MSRRDVYDSLLRIGYSIIKPRFILFHAIYIMAATILGSILIYPVRNIAYIDALFLAAGAATQSGLNTVDLNNVTVWQQVVLYLIPAFTNPMSIHTCLVFVRLYWFEKAFKDIAQKSRLDHRVRKARSYAVDERDIEGGQGVEGRPIRILRSEKMTETNFPGYRGMTAPHQRTDSDLSADHEPPFKVGNRHPRRGSDQIGDELAIQDDSDNEESGESSQSSDPKWGLANDRPSSSSDDRDHDQGPHSPTSVPNQSPAGRDIRFVDLPSPRNQQLDRPYSYLEHGPALVIKSPRQQELEAELAAADAKQRGTTDIQFASPIAGVRHHLPFKRRKSAASFGFTRRSGGSFDQEHDEDDDDVRNHTLRPTRSTVVGPSRNGADGSGNKIMKRAITIEAPESSEGRPRGPPAKTNSFGDLIFYRSTTIDRIERIVSRTLKGKRDGSPNSRRSVGSRRSLAVLPYLSYEPTLARNSTFVGLTDEQREELGGVEYRALRTLAIVLIAYFFGFLVLAHICLIPWILRDSRYRPVPESYAQKPAWWGAFMATSSFMDVGLSIVPTSMIEFQLAVFPLLLMSFMIVIGNTGFPCMLRLIIWTMSKLVPAGSAMQESLLFLLDHPRRCFTLLFPSGPTWWLFAVLVILNGADLILFVVLDIGNSLFASWSAGQKILDGLFQAFSTRTAGLAVVDLSLLHPAVQVSYLVMMYISVLPIAISVRRTNVYEEQSLGIYDRPEDEVAEDNEDDEEFSERGDEMLLDNDVPGANGLARRSTNPDDPEKLRRRSSIGRLSKRRFKPKQKKQPTSFVANHLRRQLSFDLWYIFLGLFIVCIAEGRKLQDPNAFGFNIFSVLFEVVSAYGTVGLSLGYPGTSTSFSAQLSVISKLVIIAMMIRGRHRGLPYALDRAIILPSESMAKKDMKQESRAERRLSLGSNPGMPRTSTFGRTSGFEPPREV
ncbi:cation transport protein-domain-containing protein [Lipomyces tetrasporus]|uniref:Potassium transport protein n=1 Tax=Lipomyces tetrasporus TaxID=54092 RepID=A0AAD7VPM1_9ASCO|nr:cation transport protein-domain-containing protein [Lipomyces tetrasporus]KAJ8097957.1 cation transport protein-domain-containing protein [Lipomyces tetrasporus]